MGIGSLFLGKAVATAHPFTDISSDTLSGSIEEKESIKQSTAAMMFFWVCTTRHTLRENLVAGNFSEWYQTGIPQAMGKEKFEHAASTVASDPEILKGLNVINRVADSFWYSQDGCPPTAVLRGMVGSTLDHIDRHWKLRV